MGKWSIDRSRSSENAPLRFAFESFGVQIHISVNGEGLDSTIPSVLPPVRRPNEKEQAQRAYKVSGDSMEGFHLLIDEDSALQFRTLGQLLEFLEGDIQIFVAEFATPYLFVHAGVVAWDGLAIMIPGRSFAGKSTLVTSLVKAGATYYSDEYAVLDDQGHVIPYPRRVSLRNGPHGPSGRLDFSHRAPQGAAEDHEIPVGLVALLRYDEDGGWDACELDHLPAIMAMSEQTVAVQRRPADTFAILDKVVGNARVIQGTRGEVDDTVRRLQSMVARIP